MHPTRPLPLQNPHAALVSCPHHVIAAPHDGHLIVGMMGKVEAGVSMRLHALIFAAGLGVPLVGVVYDPKVSGFLDYLQETRYLDLETVAEDTVSALIDDALAQGVNGYSARRLRALAEENEQAARRLLEEAP